jgi:hypothetical protein
VGVVEGIYLRMERDSMDCQHGWDREAKPTTECHGFCAAPLGLDLSLTLPTLPGFAYARLQGGLTCFRAYGAQALPGELFCFY